MKEQMLFVTTIYKSLKKSVEDFLQAKERFYSSSAAYGNKNFGKTAIKRKITLGIKYFVSFYCNSECDGCPFSAWYKSLDGETYCDGQWGEGTIAGSDFGKTVFLTRNEAEAALRRIDNG